MFAKVKDGFRLDPGNDFACYVAQNGAAQRATLEKESFQYPKPELGVFWTSRRGVQKKYARQAAQEILQAAAANNRYVVVRVGDGQHRVDITRMTACKNDRPCSSCCAAADLDEIVVEIVWRNEPLSVLGLALKSNDASAPEVSSRFYALTAIDVMYAFCSRYLLSCLSHFLQAFQQSTGVRSSERWQYHAEYSCTYVSDAADAPPGQVRGRKATGHMLQALFRGGTRSL